MSRILPPEFRLVGRRERPMSTMPLDVATDIALLPLGVADVRPGAQ